MLLSFYPYTFPILSVYVATGGVRPCYRISFDWYPWYCMMNPVPPNPSQDIFRFLRWDAGINKEELGMMSSSSSDTARP